ncbi:hypothetical protein EYX78_07135 [Escherichia coli]|nr:hypothetical protein EYX78_07135 [Escherichia coli]
MFWNLEVITSTGKSLCIITQIQFNIIYIMRTNGKDGRNWLESLTLGVDWLLSAMIQNHPFLQTNQNRMSVNSK